jgi:hypothetical protein
MWSSYIKNNMTYSIARFTNKHSIHTYSDNLTSLHVHRPRMPKVHPERLQLYNCINVQLPSFGGDLVRERAVFILVLCVFVS